MKKILACAIAIFNLTIMNNCFAWNAVGHMVIAKIAYQNLTSVPQAKIDTAVSEFAKEYPDLNTFPLIAPWLDAVHWQQNIDVFTHWHYVGFEFKDGAPIKSNLDSDNALWALAVLQPILKNPAVNQFERARFLAIFVHVVGDIHQPLHAASRVSDEHPDGDQGGNLYFIQYPEGTTIPLHSLWDNGCDFFSGDTSSQNIDALAQKVTADYPQAFFGDLSSDVSPSDWAQEDMKLAISQVYLTPANQVPSAEYLDVCKKTVEQRAALAGYRLAFILNKLMGIKK